MIDGSSHIDSIYRKLQYKSIVDDVNMEINRQDDIWGLQNHSLSEWIAILGEEFGEACKEVSEIRMAKDLSDIAVSMSNLDEELIQVIAVCFRILEKTRKINNVNS